MAMAHIRTTLFSLALLLGTSLASAAVDIDRISSPVTYLNTSNNFRGMYAGYQVVNNSGTDIGDLWVGTENFSGPFISTADIEDGFVSLGPLAAGEMAYAYIYLKSTAVATGETHDVSVYDGVPPALGGVGTQVLANPTAPGGDGDGSGVQSGLGVSFTLDAKDTIGANANKVVTTVVGPNPPELGGVMTITTTGATGTIGAADGSIFAGTPAVLSDWPADSLTLVTTSIEMTGGNTISVTDKLFLGGLNSTSTDYTIVFTFVVTGPVATPTSVVPVNFISSGGQIKHTGKISETSFPPIDPVENKLTLSKAANPTALPIGGGTVTYTVTMTNSGAVTTSLRDLVDTLPTPALGTVSYDPGSATFDGSPYPDSQLTISGQQLTWLGPFALPAGGSRQFTYDVTYASVPGADYDNNAFGSIGLQQIDTTLDTDDDAPAIATVAVEAAPDFDGDGITDLFDADDDNDGIPDVEEGSGDADGDGVINSFDIDSDGDGIVDNIEAQAEGSYTAPSGNDTDNDGLDDAYDPDNGGVAISIVNTDGTDQPDYLDNDSDNDGVTDLIEGHDADNNGIADVVPANTDADGDGLDDNFDTVARPAAGNSVGSNSPLQNTDSSDNRDWRDADDDNDGTPTSGEDANNNSNFADDDADADGKPDYLESSIIDSDGDGAAAQFDPDDTNPCIPSTFAPGCFADTDGDGVLDSDEGEFTDSDGDGTPDYLEASNADADGDGVNDQDDPANLDPCIPSTFAPGCGTDTDGDGTPDSVEGEFTDSDGDGTPDYQEASNADADGDGVNDQDDIANLDPCIPSTFGTNCTTDTDGDGAPDSVEGELTDSDGDGTPDYQEASNADADGDGTNDQDDPANLDPCIPSTFGTNCTTDTDGDGAPDSVEGELTDSDGDGTPDYQEASNADADGDGVNDQDDPANLDPCIPSTFAPGCSADTDGDGTPDGVEGEFTDSDGDGTPDYLEASNADADGDGVNDQDDPANLNPCIPSTFGTNCTTDTDGDGAPDSVEGELTDSDGDGTPDYQEASNADADGDGTNDQDDSANLDPCIPSTFGTNCTTDTDGDGTPDSIEGELTDSDGDGTPDYQEASNADADGDGTNDQDDPANLDPCIPSTFGTNCTTDTDGDGTPDSVEGELTDSDGDGTPDYQEASNADADGDGVNDQDDPANLDPCIPSTFAPTAPLIPTVTVRPTASKASSPTRTATARPTTTKPPTPMLMATASTIRTTLPTSTRASRPRSVPTAPPTLTVMVRPTVSKAS